ncbi:MAG: hypothetical protein WC829_02855 [Hyphomicrobium sp.]|jgi:hypothetical protein
MPYVGGHTVGTTLGRTKRQDLEDQMKRRAVERQLAELAKKNPDALVQIANTRKPGGGAYAVAPGGPAAAIAERRAGATGGAPNGAVTGAFAGSPAAVGDKWRVSDAERAAGDTYNVDRDNRPAPTDMQTQQGIRERLNADLDKSADIQRALLARGNAAGAPAAAAAPAVATVDPKVRAKAKAEVVKWQTKINAEEAKDKPNAANLKLYKEQLAAATASATPAAAPVAAAPPPARFANRESWALDPDIGNAMLTNRPEVPAAPDAAIAAKRGPAVALPSHAQPYGAAPLAGAAVPATPSAMTRTLKDGTKVNVMQQADGSWVEV